MDEPWLEIRAEGPMFVVPKERSAALHGWFVPERPGPLVGAHVFQTQNGACLVDRWPNPQAVLAECGGNYALVGDPRALAPDDLQERIVGFVDAPEGFEPLLQAAFPNLVRWDRVILELTTPPSSRSSPTNAAVRRLSSGDAASIEQLSPDLAWIAATWGGPAGMAGSGLAWGAFVGHALVSVACSFWVGQDYEDIGVVTEPAHRGRGLSTACARAACADIQSRAKRPSWSTSPDNSASLAVAEHLGFKLHRRDRLLVVSGGARPQRP